MLSEKDMEIIQQQKMMVGQWLIELGSKNSHYAIPTYYKPNRFRRFFIKLFFGVSWVELVNNDL